MKSADDSARAQMALSPNYGHDNLNLPGNVFGIDSPRAPRRVHAQPKWIDTIPRLQYERFRACQGKVQHPTREAAENTAERQTQKWKLNETVRLVVYRCDFCRQFHTGRQYE